MPKQLCDILPNIVHHNDCKTLTISTKKNSLILTLIDRTLIFLINFLFFIFCYILLAAANCILITFHHSFGCRYLLQAEKHNNIDNKQFKSQKAEQARPTLHTHIHHTHLHT